MKGTMKRNRSLTDLVNIGAKIASRLEAVGIPDEAELRRVGPVAAHRRLEAQDPEEPLPVCYYLYSFEGALRDIHWNAIGAQRKKQLKDQIR